MEKEQISIIVPIYNAANYLEKCLDSLVQQTYTNLQIILVNDGSKDDSLAIARSYAQKDTRIVVIDKVNAGVALARNTGMEVATGKYIGFVDPDDWVEPQMYASLYAAIAASDYPIGMCNYYKDDKKLSVPKKLRVKQKTLTREQVAEEIITHMIGMDDIIPRYDYIMGAVWRCLYERSFLAQHHIQFEPRITIMEDLVFNVQALLKSPGVAIDEGIWYHYVQNPKSVLHSYNEKMWEDQIKVHDLLEKALSEADLDDTMRNRLDMRYIGMAFSAMYNEVNLARADALTERLRKVGDIWADEKFKISLKRARPLRGSKQVKVKHTNKSRVSHHLKQKALRKQSKKEVY